MDPTGGGPSSFEALGVLAFIGAGCFFASVDAALSALPESKARQIRERGGPNGRAAERWLADPDSIRARMTVMRISGLIGSASVASSMAIRYGSLAQVLAAVGVGLLYGLLMEVATTLARDRSVSLSMPLLRIARPFDLLTWPLAAPLVAIAGRVRAALGRKVPQRPEDDADAVTETDVADVIDRGTAIGSIAPDRAEMLRSVLEFRGTLAREVMVPRTQMVAFDISTPLESAVKLVTESGHSRYPVYRESHDNIVGILFAKDLFRAVAEPRSTPPPKTIGPLVRGPAVFGVESQKIADLLREMQARRTHMAIVSDEFGGTAGMITLEDILEEIVGEIHDEHDDDPPPIVEQRPGCFLVDARISVRELERALGTTLPEDESYESLGGLLTAQLGSVPKVGTELRIDGLRLTVREADVRRVSKVWIERVSGDGGSTDEAGAT